MRVFTRLDRRGSVGFAETHSGRLGPRGYRQLALSAQNLYSAEEVGKMLEPHIRCNGDIDTVYLDFENESIPVCHESELRLVARLASVYHNSLVRENLKLEIDGTNSDSENSENSLAPLDFGSVNSASTTFHSIESDASGDTEWDEAEYGDRCYHDQEFEMNQDLGQPWLEKGEAAEERWGIWS
ncbi:MAG: hypothetical protein EBR09_11395 [Proteobacteria bacterium]|jgi:hypothetical protein|nr:hypothetical protein [Pseudomonadota bacterium]